MTHRRRVQLFVVVLLSNFVFTHQAIAQKPSEKSPHPVNKEVTDSTRILILTSGPAEFNSYWLEEPFRLVVEFKSRNIVSKIGNEVVVNQGIIKRITPSFFGKGKNRLLKSLIFEFTKKVPYKIWQENNSILLEIQAPLESPAFSVEGEKVFTESETDDAIIKRLEAMDAALMQVAEPKVSLEISEQMTEEVVKETREEIGKPPTSEALVQDTPILQPTEDSKKVEVLPLLEPVSKRKLPGIVFLSAGLAIILSLGLLLWYRSRLIITKEKLWIPGKSPERRQFSRLALSRDYSRTIILRIEVPNRPESIKSFVNNISSVGLSFETKEEFKDEEPINLRLFFFGNVIPMMKIQAHIIWRKQVEPINSYGVYFDLLDEKDKIELNRYIDSNNLI